jgi:competence protein ComEA
VAISRKPEPAAIVIQLITPQPSATRAPTATPQAIQVYVSGAVAHPGVYALPWDSRVDDALTAAGNCADDADLIRVNLAERLQDGQQIYVPCRAETVTPELPTPVPRASSTVEPSPAGEKININTAGAAELEVLAGIGPVLSQRIVDYRQSNGPFRKPEDIKKVSGIGDGIFARIEDHIVVD